MKKKVRKYEQQRKRKRNILLIVFAILILIAILAGYWLYSWIMHSNVMTPDKKDYSLYIPTGADFNQVKDSLYAHDLIYNKKSFEWVSSKKGCPDHVNPGRYVLKDGMSNYQLCNMLRGGLQTPVQVKFNNMRDIKMLAGRVGREKFVDKMKNEYDKFWNENRKAKAKAVGLTPLQVSILASIVDKETNKTDEMARIAGVYLNRLKGGWLLQADPTLVFAVGDFELKRVLNVHKEVEAPYNTYKYPGLPPGPICIPSLASIDAVLNPEKHSYYYFCAKDDFSGYHNFAKTLAEHNKNAQRYQRALNNNR